MPDNGAQSSLKVSVLTGIGPYSALPCQEEPWPTRLIILCAPHQRSPLEPLPRGRVSQSRLPCNLVSHNLANQWVETFLALFSIWGILLAKLHKAGEERIKSTGDLQSLGHLQNIKAPTSGEIGEKLARNRKIDQKLTKNWQKGSTFPSLPILRLLSGFRKFSIM